MISAKSREAVETLMQRSFPLPLIQLVQNIAVPEEKITESEAVNLVRITIILFAVSKKEKDFLYSPHIHRHSNSISRLLRASDESRDIYSLLHQSPPRSESRALRKVTSSALLEYALKNLNDLVINDLLLYLSFSGPENASYLNAVSQNKNLTWDNFVMIVKSCDAGDRDIMGQVLIDSLNEEAITPTFCTDMVSDENNLYDCGLSSSDEAEFIRKAFHLEKDIPDEWALKMLGGTSRTRDYESHVPW